MFGLEVPMDIFLSHCGSEVDETDILHLKYSKSAANTLMNKYNRLFLNRKK
jgi:hypothetical protein